LAKNPDLTFVVYNPVMGKAKPHPDCKQCNGTGKIVLFNLPQDCDCLNKPVVEANQSEIVAKISSEWTRILSGEKFISTGSGVFEYQMHDASNATHIIRSTDVQISQDPALEPLNIQLTHITPDSCEWFHDIFGAVAPAYQRCLSPLVGKALVVLDQLKDQIRNHIT
jgi:hypothetical protein